MRSIITEHLVILSLVYSRPVLNRF